MGPNERSEPGKLFGTSRVLDSQPRLPQAAEKIDNQLPIFNNEVLIEVERLNIDAASFVQMEKESQGNKEKIGEIIIDNCNARGKQQNKVTGSGGVLLGRVKQIGSAFEGKLDLCVGDSVVTLVSLTLTPLHIEEVSEVDLEKHQVKVKGHAILFDSSVVAKMPTDLNQTVALAALDVCGSPALTKNYSKEGDTVIVIGAGGKAGTLSCVAARLEVGKTGQVIGIEPYEKNRKELETLGVCDTILSCDATNPIEMHSGVHRATHGKMGDIVVSVTPAPDTEMGALLCSKNNGKVIYFGMATSYSKVALGAEGIGAEAQLIFGSGFVSGHANYTLDLLRGSKPLLNLFNQRYQA